jgi:hypothetical protein
LAAAKLVPFPDEPCVMTTAAAMPAHKRPAETTIPARLTLRRSSLGGSKDDKSPPSSRPSVVDAGTSSASRSATSNVYAGLSRASGIDSPGEGAESSGREAAGVIGLGPYSRRTGFTEGVGPAGPAGLAEGTTGMDVIGLGPYSRRTGFTEGVGPAGPAGLAEGTTGMDVIGLGPYSRRTGFTGPISRGRLGDTAGSPAAPDAPRLDPFVEIALPSEVDVARAAWAASAAIISRNVVKRSSVFGCTSASTGARGNSAGARGNSTGTGRRSAPINPKAPESVTFLTAATSPVSLSVPDRIILCQPPRDRRAACQRSAAAESRSGGRFPRAGRSSEPTSPTWARREEPPTSTLGPHSTKPARAWSNSWAKASGPRSRTALATPSDRPSASVSQRAPRHCSGSVKKAKETSAASRLVSAVTGGSDASAAALEGPSWRRRSL